MQRIGARKVRERVPLLVGFAFLLACLGLAVAHHMHDPTHRGIPLSFPHAPHAQFSCVVCHHDVVEPALQDAPIKTCIACHKLTPSLSADTEALFHQFCEGCHLGMHQDHEPAGPVKDCVGCHSVHRPKVAGTFIYK